MTTITQVLYAEFYARPGNAGRWIAAFAAAGFEPAGTPVQSGRDAHIMELEGAFVVVSSVQPGSDAERHVERNGEGLADLAFLTGDLPATVAMAVEAGAVPEPAPYPPLLAGSRGPGVTLSGGPGHLRHTVYEDSGPVRASGGMQVVHAGAALDQPTLAAAWYVEAFGFALQPAGRRAARDAAITVAGPETSSGSQVMLAVGGATRAPASPPRQSPGIPGDCRGAPPAGDWPDGSPDDDGAPIVTVALPSPASCCLAFDWRPRWGAAPGALREPGDRPARGLTRRPN